MASLFIQNLLMNHFSRRQINAAAYNTRTHTQRFHNGTAAEIPNLFFQTNHLHLPSAAGFLFFLLKI